MKHECLIGAYYDYEDTKLVTFDDLVREVRKSERFGTSVYSLKDYLDKRKNTNLRRFLYCPECGEKIYWNELKEQKYELGE